MRLSIICAGRNDNHCGDFIDRLNKSLATFPSDAEIILVEWNPPEENAPLSKVISRRGVRVITVPRDIHSQMHGNELLPFFEYRAKNVGIRRASNEWILSMNPDILLTDEMRVRLSLRFDSGAFYQTNRQDMKGNEIMQVCVGPGDFMLMAQRGWNALRGYLDLVSYSHLDSLLCWNAEHYGFRGVNLGIPILHQEHERSVHKTRMTIHSSDVPKFIGLRNDENWGLADIHLPEVTT